MGWDWSAIPWNADQRRPESSPRMKVVGADRHDDARWRPKTPVGVVMHGAVPFGARAGTIHGVEEIEKRTPPEHEREAAHRLLTQIAPRIDELQTRWEGPDHSAEPGSPLAGDDRHSRPYHVSHAAWLSIGHAIDNLVALRSLTVSNEGNEITLFTRAFAAYPLVRAALENASVSLWLIGPKSRDERLTRRFRKVLTDAANRDSAVALAKPDAELIRDRQTAEISQLALARGLDAEACEKRVFFGEVVRGGHAVMGLDEETGEAVWRILSALTHGDSWASHLITDRDEVQVHADGDVFAEDDLVSDQHREHDVDCALGDDERNQSL